ncbi:unnamed protein product [Anisakis simplex]|uniref:SH2 domain-containing protein n=1 Tax=Anisakis simplex TaxID=6269 RepID=A0A0M3KHU0_ANISI|nr:unnamed protein product [Anisakis simplex]
MKEYDECWPIRFSVRKIYGTGTDSDDSDNDADNDSDNRNDHKEPSNQSVRHKRPRGLVMCIICTTLHKVCVAVNIRNRQITAKVDSKSREESSNSTMKYVCKPFWEDGGLGLGLHRQEAGPWQTRIKLSGRNILAISTQIRMNYTDRQNPHHQLLYDYAVLRRYTPGSEEELLAKYVCMKGADSGWFVLFEYQ